MTFEQRVALPLPTVKLFENLNTISVNDFYAKLIRGGTELYQKKLGTNFEEGELIRIMYNGEFLALGRVCEFENGSAVKPEKLFIL